MKEKKPNFSGKWFWIRVMDGNNCIDHIKIDARHLQPLEGITDTLALELSDHVAKVSKELNDFLKRR